MKNKRFLSFVLCIVLVMSLFTGIVSTASADDVITHTVKNGEYLYKICKGYGLDYYACKNAIMILNGFTSDTQLNRLTVGQIVKLPATNALAATVTGSSSTTTTVASSTTINGVTTTTTSTSTVNGTAGTQSGYSVAYYLIPHVVKSGETLAQICNYYGTSYAQYSNVILTVNGLGSAANVWAGKTVYIPSAKAPSSGSCYAVVAHTVKSGETLTSICSSYGINYAANTKMVTGLNYGKNLSTIYVGQTINVPVVATVSASSTSYSGTTSAVSSSTVVQSGYYIDFESETSSKGSPYAVANDSVVSKAEAGTTVTIMPNPKYGFAQTNVNVYRSDSSAEVVVKNNTFVMPACDVVITIDYGSAYSITKKPTAYGTFITLVNGVQSDFAVANDTVLLSFATDYGYTCTEACYYAGSSSTPTSITQSTDGTWSFVMPGDDIRVEVTFAKGTNLQKITTNREIWSYDLSTNNLKSCVAANNAKAKNSATVTYNVNGTACTKAAAGTQVTVEVTPKTNYALYNVTVVDGNNKAVTCTKVDDLHYTFMMPANGATVTAKTYYSVWHYLLENAYGCGTILFTDTEGKAITYAQVGDEVHLIFKPYSGYSYKNNSLSVTYGGTTSIPAVKVDEKVYNEFKFTMVDADVTATVAWEQSSDLQSVVYMYSCPAGNYDIKVKPVNGTATRTCYAMEGETVIVDITSVTGYVCTRLYAGIEGTTEIVMDSAKAGSGAITRSETDNDNIVSGSFVMPGGGNVYVIAEFEAKSQFVNIAGYGTDGNDPKGSVIAYNASYQQIDNVTAGSTIILAVTAKTGYRLVSLDAYVRNTDKTYNLSVSDNYAYFTVPAEAYNAVDSSKNCVDIIPSFECSTEYTITRDGANYTCSLQSAGIGETVYLTANDGYLFKTDSITIYSGTGSDGSKVNFKNAAGSDVMDDDYTYKVSSDRRTVTFNMPAANVYVNAGTENNVTSYSITCYGSNYTSSAATAKAGESVVLTADSGYVFTSADRGTISTDRTTVTFIMPAENVTVYASTAVKSAVTKIIDSNASDGNYTAVTEAVPGAVVTLSALSGKFNENAVEVYTYETTASGKVKKLEDVDCLINSAKTEITFTMPSLDVKVKAFAGDLMIDCNGTGYEASKYAASAGETIKLSPTSGYSSLKVKSVAAYKDNVKAYELSFTANSDGTYSFTVPVGYNVVVNAEATAAQYKISMADVNAGYTISPSGSVQVGTVVTLKADSGRQFESPSGLESLTGYSINSDSTEIRFQMPENDLTVTATTRVRKDTLYSLFYDQSYSYAFTVSHSQTTAGTKVTVAPNSGYKLSVSVCTLKSDNTKYYDVACNGPDAEGKYTFIMPEYNVWVQISLDYQTYTIDLAGAVSDYTCSCTKTDGTATALAGTGVVLTAVSGKKFTDVLITYGSDGKILSDYTFGSDSRTISFTMPGGNVTVEAYTDYTALQIINGSTDCFNIDKTSANPGETVTIKANDGFKFGSTVQLYTLKNGTKFADVVAVSSTETEIVFTMPDYSVYFAATADYRSYTIDLLGDSANYTCNCTKDGTTKATVGTGVVLTAASGKKFKDVTITYGSGAIGFSDYTFSSDSSAIYFNMPAGDAKVTAYVTDSALQIYNAGGGYFTIDKTTANSGDTVTVTASDGYKFGSTIYMSKLDAYGNKTGNVDYTLSPDGTEITFAMPECNVQVSATTEAVWYDIVISSANCTAYYNGGAVDKMVAGVGISLIPESGKCFKNVTITKDEDGTVVTSYMTYDSTAVSFTMPAGSVTVTAVVE